MSEDQKTSPTQQASAAKETSSAPVPVTEPTTPPGTTLNMGQRAVIPYQDGVIALTVTALEPGDQASFEQNFGEDAKSATPYYIRYTVENLAGTDLSGKNGPELRALLPDGTTTGVFITGDLPPACVHRLSPADFTKPGAKYENCQLDAADKDDQVVAVGYDEGDYDDAAIVWRKPGS